MTTISDIVDLLTLTNAVLSGGAASATALALKWRPLLTAAKSWMAEIEAKAKARAEAARVALDADVRKMKAEVDAATGAVHARLASVEMRLAAVEAAAHAVVSA